MRVGQRPYRSPLSRLQPVTMDTDSVKRTGWQKDQILVVHAADVRLSDMERAYVRRIGNKLYGKTLESTHG
jgi:hypothetical protein